MVLNRCLQNVYLALLKIKLVQFRLPELWFYVPEKFIHVYLIVNMIRIC